MANKKNDFISTLKAIEEGLTSAARGIFRDSVAKEMPAIPDSLRPLIEELRGSVEKNKTARTIYVNRLAQAIKDIQGEEERLLAYQWIQWLEKAVKNKAFNWDDVFAMIDTHPWNS